MIDCKQRREARGVRVFDQLRMPVIQDLPAALETRSQHGVILADRAVANQH